MVELGNMGKLNKIMTTENIRNIEKSQSKAMVGKLGSVGIPGWNCEDGEIRENEGTRGKYENE